LIRVAIRITLRNNEVINKIEIDEIKTFVGNKKNESRGRVPIDASSSSKFGRVPNCAFTISNLLFA